MSVNLATNKALLSKLALVRLVLMDIDGTLITGRDDTLDNVVLQLKRLRARSIRFSIATGRTLTGAAMVLDRLQSTHAKLPAMIAYNGGVVAIPEPRAIIERNVIPPENVQTILECLQDAGIDALIYTCATELDLTPIERVIDFGPEKIIEKDFNGMSIEYRQSKGISEVRDVISILGVTNSHEEAEKFVSQFQHSFSAVAKMTTSGHKFIEIAAANTGKYAGMNRLGEMLSLSTESIMCIGDSYNDKEMLQKAGVGVAVANAPTEVQSIATYVCQNSGAEGVVEALRMLIDAHRLSGLIVKAGVDR